MNGFISCHMLIKEVFNTNCVMTYNTLSNRQRKKKSDFFDKLYDDQFSKLQIKRFYLKTRSIFVRQERSKDNIIKLFISIMTAKIKKFDEECVRVDNAAVISNKTMFEIIGQSRYYSRNEDSIHETILDSRFMDPFFGFV